VSNRIQHDSSGKEADSLQLLAVYRNLQPCPLRSTIDQLKVVQVQESYMQGAKSAYKNNSDKMTKRRFDFIKDFIGVHK